MSVGADEDEEDEDVEDNDEDNEDDEDEAPGPVSPVTGEEDGQLLLVVTGVTDRLVTSGVGTPVPAAEVFHVAAAAAATSAAAAGAGDLVLALRRFLGALRTAWVEDTVELSYTATR